MVHMTEWIEINKKIAMLTDKAYGIEDLILELDKAYNDDHIDMEEYLVAKVNFSISLVTMMGQIIQLHERLQGD